MKPSRSRTTRTDRRRAERAGRRGEAAAALFLRAKLYRIVAHRYRSPVGEIDLVARKGNTLVFVEVKSRRSRVQLETAFAAVNAHRIERAAGHFLARHPQWAAMNIRFDVIFVAPRAWPLHVRDAFYTESQRVRSWR